MKQRWSEKIAGWRDHLIWIVLVVAFLFVYPVSAYAIIPYYMLINALYPYLPEGIYTILAYYTVFIVDLLIVFLVTWLIRSNRYIWRSFLLPKSAAAGPGPDDMLAEFYGRSRNGFKVLGWGMLLGFVMNLVCIGCTLLHGDIALYFDASPRQIPVFLFALVSIAIQSAAEELYFRGFLYERLHKRYPLWVAVLVNGIFFGVAHLIETDASVLSVVEIAVCGVSFALLRWYAGNIWTVIGVHTAWNFTQNFLFGLPNSGIVPEVSLFHLGASTDAFNLFFDPCFGVEGGLPSLCVNALLAAVCLLLAARAGRLKELGWNRARTMEAGETRQ